MALEPPPSSPSKSLKTNPPSPSSTTPVPQQRLVASDEVVVLSSVVVAVAVGTYEAVGAPFNVLAAEEVVRDKIAIMITAVVEGVGEGDLGGRTMTSLSGTETRVSTSSRIGKCSKRLISIVWLS